MAVGDRDLSRSRAVLIGNGAFRPDSGIPALPVVGACVTALAELLTSDLCGWPPDRIEVLADVATGGELARRLTQAVADVRDVLLVYYVGRGLRTDQGELALALADSDANPALVAHTAIRYQDLAGILLRCPAASKLVLLDCENAESAAAHPIDGLYLVGAGTPAAGAPPYGPPAALTAAVIDAVRTGVPDGPDVLTMDQIFPWVRDRILREGLPAPVELGRGVPQYAFAYNAASLPAAPSPALIPGWMSGQPALGDASAQAAGPAPAPGLLAKPPALTRRRLLIGAGAVVVAGGGAAAGLLLSGKKNGGGSGGGGGGSSVPALAGRLRWSAPSLTGNTSGLPVVVGQTVYVSCYNQSSTLVETGGCVVYALDAATGAQRWTAPVSGSNIGLGDPVPAAGNVIVNTFGSVGAGGVGPSDVLYAFDAATGVQRWTFKGGNLLGIPAVTDGTVYISDSSTTNTTMSALNPATGAVVWNQTLLADTVGTTTASASGIYVTNSGALTTSTLYALDPATGTQRWTSPTLNAPFLGTATAAGATVYVGGASATDSSQAHVFALNASTGARRWTSPTLKGAVAGVPLVIGDTLYVNNYVDATSTYLYALDAATGAVRWQFSQQGLFGPIVTGGLVYVGAGLTGGTGALYALDAATGARRWSAALAANGANGLLPRGDTLYVTDYHEDSQGDGTGDCAVYALDAAAGTRRWRLPLSGRSISNPVAAGSTLYVSGVNTDGKTSGLYAIE